MMNHKPLFILVTLLLSTLAQADETAHACASIEDASMRLSCYDHLYLHQQSADKPSSKTVDLEQTYQRTVNENNPQIVFTQPEQVSTTIEEPSYLTQLYDLNANRQGGILTVREHEPIYLLPAWYRSSPNYYPSSPTRTSIENDVQTQQKRLEAKMQVSFKTKLLEDVFKTRADVWFGYTQQSNWQVYNQGKKSAPFRNNDYAPEIFITQPVKASLPFGGELKLLGAGYIHQSNGQSRPLSRSWNRIYAMAGMEWGKLTVAPRIWARIDSKGEDDDNPDITDYMGYGDVRIHYQFNDKQAISSTLRYNPFKNRGAIQLGYTFPLKGKLKAYVQGFYGYGESLLDYNHKQKAIGVGVLLNDWNGL